MFLWGESVIVKFHRCRDINKLFELLNKHVNQPVSYPKHETKKTKKKKKEKVKTRITNFRIPQIKHKKPHVVQRKKIVEVKNEEKKELQMTEKLFAEVCK